MELIFGYKSIVDSINYKTIKILNIFIAINTNEKLIKLLKNNNIKFELVEKKFFEKFNKTLNHQNCVAYIETNNKYNSIDEYFLKNNTKDESIIVILDEIEDPRNFGSIIRTSFALGADAIIYKKNNQAQINDIVSKTSLGSSNVLPLIKETNLSLVIEKLKKRNYWIYTSILDTNSVDYNKTSYYEKIVLIVGNESNGVSKQLIKKSDFLIKIPMKNGFESLNVSVALGIMLSNIIK